MGLIVDTSVLVAAERRRQSVLQILEQIRSNHRETEIGLSVVTIAEMMHGAFRSKLLSDKQRHLAFIERLSSDVAVYPLTIEASKRLGQIAGEQGARGISIAFEDLAIGCTALQLGFGVATLNVRHFSLIPGLNVVQF